MSRVKRSIKKVFKVFCEGDNIDIDEPVLFEENKIIPLQDRIIQGIIFRPYKSTLLPCSIKFVGKSEQDIIKMPGCCEYKVVYNENGAGV